MANKISAVENAACPCGSAVEFVRCCGCYLDGSAVPQSAEQLMRSRYCGFVHGDESYLLATWHPDTRPSRVRFDENTRWLGLRIRGAEAGGPGDSAGSVEFVARYKVDGKGHRLHELSHFEKIDGRWYYKAGQHL